MDEEEFKLRLIAIVLLSVFLIVDAIYWKIDHAVIVTISFIIGLMTGIRIRRIVIAPDGGDESG